eukprot:scaffold49021_cov68-Attheya_sp.AAC.1
MDMKVILQWVTEQLDKAAHADFIRVITRNLGSDKHWSSNTSMPTKQLSRVLTSSTTRQHPAIQSTNQVSIKRNPSQFMP